MSEKPIHVKASFYANCFFMLKEIAFRYGYNLVLHGSMSRDLDLIAIPWIHKTKPVDKMIWAFAKALHGRPIMLKKNKMQITKMPHGREAYVIDLARFDKDYYDRQYYVDISVMPTEPPTSRNLNK